MLRKLLQDNSHRIIPFASPKIKLATSARAKAVAIQIAKDEHAKKNLSFPKNGLEAVFSERVSNSLRPFPLEPFKQWIKEAITDNSLQDLLKMNEKYGYGLRFDIREIPTKEDPEITTKYIYISENSEIRTLRISEQDSTVTYSNVRSFSKNPKLNSYEEFLDLMYNQDEPLEFEPFRKVLLYLYTQTHFYTDMLQDIKESSTIEQNKKKVRD